MAQPCKVFSYTNVGTEKGVLANIASAAQAGGWTVDKNAVDADGELYLHSAGGGNRRLFFSLRLLQAHDNAERFLLAVHGNTGFDASAAWDAQPGRFTERLAHGYCSRTTGKPIWLRTPGKYSITSTGWWILPPVAEQIVLVCPTFVMTAMRVVYTFSDGANTPYSGWVPLMFGAADGFDAETELNMVLWSAWSANSAMGLILSALYVAQRDVNNEYYFCNNNYGNVGLLWKGANVEKFPPEGTYGYRTSPLASSVVRTSVTVRNVIGQVNTDYCLTGTVNVGGKTINYTHKGGVCASVPQYNAALLQNSGTLRHMLIKPLLYVCNGADVRLAGELPYWAVNLHGLKPKDRISIGSRLFMVLPDISDSDAIGLAVEVEA